MQLLFILLLVIATLQPAYTDIDSETTARVGTIYACSPVFIRTSPSYNAPIVVLPDDTYAVVLPNDVVVYNNETAHWVHLVSEIGFIPALALDDDTCWTDMFAEPLACLQQYANSVPNANPDAAFIVAAYLYYSAHYRVDPIFVLAQAFHESNIFRSQWAIVHHNYAGLWVSGAVRNTKPTYGYWVATHTVAGTVWVAGRSFPSITDGVETHVRIVAAYPSEQAVLARWATDPLYSQKIQAWYHRILTYCPYSYDTY